MATYEDAKFARMKLLRACEHMNAISSIYVSKNDEGDHVVRVYLVDKKPEGLPEFIDGVEVVPFYLHRRQI